MGTPAYVPYKRREYCKDIRCPIQHQLDKHQPGTDEYEQVRGICKAECIHTTYEFHHWLMDHGYEIVRPESAAGTTDAPQGPQPAEPKEGRHG
jgi:hypothetical protein